MIALTDRATVYEPDSTGRITQPTKVGLRCRLQEGRSMVVPDPVFADRQEASRLVWEASYDMPDICQVELDGSTQRYTVQVGTMDDVRTITGVVVAHRAIVTRLGHA